MSANFLLHSSFSLSPVHSNHCYTHDAIKVSKFCETGVQHLKHTSGRLAQYGSEPFIYTQVYIHVNIK